MQFAKRVFLPAGIWGVVVVALGYAAFWMGINPDLLNPPDSEIVHGFFLIAFAWQVQFLLIPSHTGCPGKARPKSKFLIHTSA